MDKMSVTVAAVTVVDVLVVFSHVKILVIHRATKDQAITTDLTVRRLEHRTSMAVAHLVLPRIHMEQQPPQLILQN